jgi:hypothetical protein
VTSGYVLQLGQAMHEPQTVLVELVFVQIWTPGEPPLCVQSRTSCSMQMQ